MKEQILTEAALLAFKEHLQMEEKTALTIQKYVRDARAFMAFSGKEAMSKKIGIAYKQYLIDRGYAVRSINSMLASLNSLFSFLECPSCRIKMLKLQQQIFCPEERELSKQEYLRLCNAASSRHNYRLYMILQTICSTGIRVSELQYITVEAVKHGDVEVCCKGKIRKIFLVKPLQKKLLRYAAKQNIKGGAIFVTRAGKPVDRVSVWREMKKLCTEAKVNPQKVFPHNLRHLFARIFYRIEKDIAKLADILGHSSINTTRIYIISTGTEHREKLERMKLVL